MRCEAPDIPGRNVKVAIRPWNRRAGRKRNAHIAIGAPRSRRVSDEESIILTKWPTGLGAVTCFGIIGCSYRGVGGSRLFLNRDSNLEVPFCRVLISTPAAVPKACGAPTLLVVSQCKPA